MTQKYFSNMECGKCEKLLHDCTCTDLNERMRELTDPGMPMIARWCATCDHHYVRCKCEVPYWMVRDNGQLRPMPIDQ